MRAGWITMLLVACATDDKDSSTTTPIEQGGDTSTETCGGTAPVISELLVEAGDGLSDFEGDSLPYLVVSVTGTDADSDLETMTVDLWWDEAVDGAVDTTGEATQLAYTFDTGPCSSTGNTLNISLPVDGGRFEYVTPYEFAGLIYDSTDMASEIVIASGTSPNELGE